MEVEKYLMKVGQTETFDLKHIPAVSNTVLLIVFRLIINTNECNESWHHVCEVREVGGHFALHTV